MSESKGCRLGAKKHAEVVKELNGLLDEALKQRDAAKAEVRRQSKQYKTMIASWQETVAESDKWTGISNTWKRRHEEEKTAHNATKADLSLASAKTLIWHDTACRLVVEMAEAIAGKGTQS